MESILQTFANMDETYVRVFLAVMRFIAPALAFLLLWRCLKPLVAFKRSPEIWGWLQINGGDRFVLTHLESASVIVQLPSS